MKRNFQKKKDFQKERCHRLKKGHMPFFCGSIFVMLAAVIIIATVWARNQFTNLDLSALIFQLKVPLEGTSTDSFQGIIGVCLLAAPIAAVACYLFSGAVDGSKYLEFHVGPLHLRIRFGVFRRHYLRCSAMALVFALTFSLLSFQVPAYVKGRMSRSSLYEEYYVDPRGVTLTFPEKKRNLIYIFMESMEMTYQDETHGGGTAQNHTPEMTELQQENICFGEPGQTNGAVAATGTTWTMGAIVAQTAGISLNIPVGANAMEEGYTSFLPGAYSIGQVLEKQGYHQEFLLGSNAVFGGRKTYMKSHGDYAIKDYEYARAKGWIDPDYYVWWGYEDQKLYQFAKKRLTKLAKRKEPFNLTMLTVDTHFTGGYPCERCPSDFGEDQYGNVIACASRQVAEFVRWIQQQDFYENTTIVICGDHPTMDDDYVNNTMQVSKDYERKVYTAIIHPAAEVQNKRNRSFTTMDMYPTTLAGLGVKIQGERLALGTNLFSDQPTLLEELGREVLDQELNKQSVFYEKKLLYGTDNLPL